MTISEFQKRYEYDPLADRLGEGGFGKVYKAYDNVLHRYVAVKVSEAKVINGKEFSLKAEFDALSHLPKHGNVANYEELHRFSTPMGVFDYAIMQYYADGDLSKWIGRLTKEQAVQVATELLNGIAFLHKHNVIHRDLKPGNIMVACHNGKVTPLITDFGLSKEASTDANSLFSNSTNAGTLKYSSPEQLEGKPLRFNSDLWSYGAIVYELLTGHQLFEIRRQQTESHKKMVEIYNMIVSSNEKDSKIATLPLPWREVAERCLVRDNRLRAKSADELFGIINGGNQTADDENTVLETSKTKPASYNDEGTITGETPKKPDPKPATQPKAKPNHKKRWPIVLGSIAALLLLTLVTMLALRTKTPMTMDELRRTIKINIILRGPNCDLNDIDVSNVTDMSWMFSRSPFNGDISKWDVSKVTDMSDMFSDSQFHGDISKWDVSKVKDMNGMFHKSRFNGDISKWNVSNVTDMRGMFYGSQFTGDISKWNVSKVTDMRWMFSHSQFNGDISKWDVSNVKDMGLMFADSPFNGDISKWNVSKVESMWNMFDNSPLEGREPSWYRE